MPAATATANRTFTAMDTAMTITVNSDDQNAANEAVDACATRVAELDALLAPSGEASELARLNAAEGVPTTVSADVQALVEAAVSAAHETDGAFDPTVYPLTAAWGFTSGKHRTPSADELATLLPHVDYEAVTVDDATDTVSLANGAQIDVGGVAKGFAADELQSILAEHGVASALLDLGGNVTAVGAKPDGSPWKVGVADPAAPDQLAGTLELSDATVSTSGAYQRFFTDDAGVLRHHLIDPSTGYPADSDLVSASVIGPNGARCDALSTALYVMGLDRALAFWRACDAEGGDVAFEAVLIASDGTVHVTAGIADAFVPAEAYADTTEVER